MLKSVMLRVAVLLALVAASGTALVGGSPAAAQVSCPEGQPVVVGGIQTCVLVSSGSATSTGGSTVQVSVTGSTTPSPYCENRAGVAPSGFGGAPEGMVRCYIDGLGWWDGYDCYYNYQPGTPPDSDMSGYDQHGDDGLVYRIQCFLEHAYADGLWFDYAMRVLPEPPEFEGGEPPWVLIAWEEVINSMEMTGPQIGIIPYNGVGLVRLPVWMWDEGESSVPGGPISAGGGPEVSALATIDSIVWNPGDGSPSIPCGQGIPYESGMDVFATDCKHQYSQPSRNQPGGVYQIVATTTWNLEWWVDGVPDGQLTLEAASAVDIQINELQVLTRS